MAVIELKSYKLQYLTYSKGYEDENGDYHQGDRRWVGDIKCDVVGGSVAKEVTFEDGTTDVYSYVVYLDADCREFLKGDRVRITFNADSAPIIADKGNVKEFEVKGFRRYQLQAKLWV